MRFQETTLLIGRMLIPPHVHDVLPAGLQDAITPKAQTSRNIGYFILLIVLLLYGVIFIKWYVGVVVLLSTFIGIPIMKIFLPQAGSPYYTTKIIKDLHKRKSEYEKSGDTMRKMAIQEIISLWETGGGRSPAPPFAPQKSTDA
jgi:hypothetical protein